MKSVGTEHCQSINLSKQVLQGCCVQGPGESLATGDKDRKLPSVQPGLRAGIKNIQLFLCQFIQLTDSLLGLTEQ